MRYLVVEMLLRLVKPALALVIGLVLYWVIVGLLGHDASPELALLSWISAAALILLLENSPI